MLAPARLTPQLVTLTLLMKTPYSKWSLDELEEDDDLEDAVLNLHLLELVVDGTTPTWVPERTPDLAPSQAKRGGPQRLQDDKPEGARRDLSLR